MSALDQEANSSSDRNPVDSIHHLLYLHQNDHPGMILATKKLVGSENYSTWKRSIMIALGAKNKLKLVDGSFPEPDRKSSLRPHWERANDMVISWILNTVTQIERLWNELDALEAPYACTSDCTCDSGRLNGEREHRKRLIQFLMGLDESYTNIRGQILRMQPLPTVAKAYTMLRQEEKQRENPKVDNQKNE